MGKPIFHRNLILLSFVLTVGLNAQIGPDRYWIQFTDKNNSPYSTDRPEEFLSDRAINRRTSQYIPIEDNDLPVNQSYLDSLRAIGLTVISTSKWLNGAIVESNSTPNVMKALDFTFVSDIPLFTADQKAEVSVENKFSDNDKSAYSLSYGYSLNQIEMLNGGYLHESGFQGQGMLIAVLDAGFDNVDNLSSLQHLWNDNRIVTYRDYVQDYTSFFNTYRHGTIVLAAMAGIIDNTIYGTAPEAEYALIRTEKYSYEYLVEEYNWVCGAEFADSLGADLINSSLGYTEFDNELQNHTYSNMDGKQNISAIGAGIAASKGMIVVSSAGNDGGHAWYHISSPCDADGILCAGAVYPAGTITEFSSRGPSYDQRIKPDVCAQGSGVFTQDSDGEIKTTSGTSLSSPLICGMTACLWQANPAADNQQVIESVIESSSFYQSPDNEYGYGIPDYGIADYILKNMLATQKSFAYSFNISPNPAQTTLKVEIFKNKSEKQPEALLTVYDLLGRNVYETTQLLGSNYNQFNLPVENLSTGLYQLVITINENIYSASFLKVE